MTEMGNKAVDSKTSNEVPEEVVASLKKKSINSEIRGFCIQVDGLANTLSPTMALLGIERKKLKKELEDKYHATVVRDKDGRRYLRYSGITADNITAFNELRKQNEKVSLAFRLIPQSYLVSLISQYDAFAGTLIHVFFQMKPELLNGSGEQFTLAELLKAGSIEAVREAVADKKVYAIMKGSHEDQIVDLQRLSGVDLKKELKSWKTFIEITERRNLFVHTGGRISQQYIEVCEKHKVDIGKHQKGDELTVSHRYFNDACECIIEVGIIIAQAMWRKLFPSEREQADTNLNDICYELIRECRYRLACTLLDHGATEFKNHASTEEQALIMLLNRAQSYKWNGDNETAAEIIRNHDWTAKGDEYKLAAAILLDNFSEAYRLMRKIGIAERPSRQAYKEWPLFNHIRKELEFMRVYEEIFKIPYVEAEAIASEPRELETTESQEPTQTRELSQSHTTPQLRDEMEEGKELRS